MNAYHTFEFSYYKVLENREIVFGYRALGDGKTEEFEEKLIPDLKNAYVDLSSNKLKPIFESLHMILGISYYKLFCPKNIVVQSCVLSRGQAAYWNNVYTKGLGEFFYKNNIDFRGLVSFPYKEKLEENHDEISLTQKALVPIGGGKDSIVTTEILKENGCNFDIYTLNAFKIQKDVAQVLGKEPMNVARYIDKKLLDSSYTQNTYQGHVPITAIYTYVGILLCMLYSYSYLILSNERSSDFGNVHYLGENISHQWSKSSEFEDLTREYVKENISTHLEYFSLLRPFYEIKIVEMFSKYPQYFEVFSSSNHNFSLVPKDINGRWDYLSPKTAFIYTMCAAFISDSEMKRIFDKDLFNDEHIIPIIKELLGLGKIKPFDCVGLPDEVFAGIFLAYKRGAYKDSLVMDYFKNEILPKANKEHNIDNLMQNAFSYGNDKNIPRMFTLMLSDNSHYDH